MVHSNFIDVHNSIENKEAYWGALHIVCFLYCLSSKQHFYCILFRPGGFFLNCRLELGYIQCCWVYSSTHPPWLYTKSLKTYLCIHLYSRFIIKKVDHFPCALCILLVFLGIEEAQLIIPVINSNKIEWNRIYWMQ